jgi:hypothetical protein
MKRKTIGPVTVSFQTCDGCGALKTEYWKDYLDNDDVDSGTMAKCLAKNKVISSYWFNTMGVPHWCPGIKRR